MSTLPINEHLDKVFGQTSDNGGTDDKSVGNNKWIFDINVDHNNVAASSEDRMKYYLRCRSVLPPDGIEHLRQLVFKFSKKGSCNNKFFIQDGGGAYVLVISLNPFLHEHAQISKQLVDKSENYLMMENLMECNCEDEDLFFMQTMARKLFHEITKPEKMKKGGVDKNHRNSEGPVYMKIIIPIKDHYYVRLPNGKSSYSQQDVPLKDNNVRSEIYIPLLKNNTDKMELKLTCGMVRDDKHDIGFGTRDGARGHEYRNGDFYAVRCRKCACYTSHYGRSPDCIEEEEAKKRKKECGKSVYDPRDPCKFNTGCALHSKQHDMMLSYGDVIVCFSFYPPDFLKDGAEDLKETKDFEEKGLVYKGKYYQPEENLGDGNCAVYSVSSCIRKLDERGVSFPTVWTNYKDITDREGLVSSNIINDLRVFVDELDDDDCTSFCTWQVVQGESKDDIKKCFGVATVGDSGSWYDDFRLFILSKMLGVRIVVIRNSFEGFTEFDSIQYQKSLEDLNNGKLKSSRLNETPHYGGTFMMYHFKSERPMQCDHSNRFDHFVALHHVEDATKEAISAAYKGKGGYEYKRWNMVDEPKQKKQQQPQQQDEGDDSGQGKRNERKNEDELAGSNNSGDPTVHEPKKQQQQQQSTSNKQQQQLHGQTQQPLPQPQPQLQQSTFNTQQQRLHGQTQQHEPGKQEKHQQLHQQQKNNEGDSEQRTRTESNDNEDTRGGDNNENDSTNKEETGSKEDSSSTGGEKGGNSQDDEQTQQHRSSSGKNMEMNEGELGEGNGNGNRGKSGQDNSKEGADNDDQDDHDKSAKKGSSSATGDQSNEDESNDGDANIHLDRKDDDGQDDEKAIGQGGGKVDDGQGDEKQSHSEERTSEEGVEKQSHSDDRTSEGDSANKKIMGGGELGDSNNNGNRDYESTYKQQQDQLQQQQVQLPQGKEPNKEKQDHNGLFGDSSPSEDEQPQNKQGDSGQQMRTESKDNEGPHGRDNNENDSTNKGKKGSEEGSSSTEGDKGDSDEDDPVATVVGADESLTDGVKATDVDDACPKGKSTECASGTNVQKKRKKSVLSGLSRDVSSVITRSRKRRMRDVYSVIKRSRKRRRNKRKQNGDKGQREESALTNDVWECQKRQQRIVLKENGIDTPLTESIMETSRENDLVQKMKDPENYPFVMRKLWHCIDRNDELDLRLSSFAQMSVYVVTFETSASNPMPPWAESFVLMAQRNNNKKFKIERAPPGIRYIMVLHGTRTCTKDETKRSDFLLDYFSCFETVAAIATKKSTLAQSPFSHTFLIRTRLLHLFSGTYITLQ